ncbi:monocarboxylate transporter 14-like isoform X2 [Physella acuta]|uniref:monocarboxylate transporter 14-like isoform X2 n=1 Tax=Physella acuta TaxID=109671 RepID=UPI0027DD10AA|nr:monocarboxylate transporter 14-like isoform X2 [Physella acuta]
MRYPSSDGATAAQEGENSYADEDEEEDDEQEEDNSHPIPPDGGWGWVVMVASFLCNMIVDGVCFSFGVVSPEFMKAFKATNSQVSWVGSSLTGCYLIVGPFVAALCTRYGCRKVTMAGSVITMAGFLLSTQSSSIEMLIATYGIIGGIGFGMIYLPSIVCVGYWFEKKRAFTTGIVVCGTGIGQFVFPPLARYLLTEYTWEGQNLIFAGIVLKCAACGMLFIPLDRWGSKKRRPVQARVEIERGAIMKALIEDKKRQRTISNGSLDNCIITKDNKLIKLDSKIFEMKRNDSFIARFKKQLGFSSQSLAHSKNSLPGFVIDAVQKSSPIYCPNGTHQLAHSQIVQKRGSLPDGIVLPRNNSSISMLTNGRIPTSNGSLAPNGVSKTRSCSVIPINDQYVQIGDDVLEMRIEQISNGGGPVVTRSTSDLQSSPTIEGNVISIHMIPSDTRTIRSNSSMASSYKSHLSSQSTYLSNSMLSIPQIQASLEQYEKELDRKSSLLYKFWVIFCEMVDIKLLINPVFALLALSTFLTLLSFFIPYFYLPTKGRSIGMSDERASFLISIIGITNTVGRIICGWVADRPCINSLHLNNCALILAGIAVLLCPLATNEDMLAAISAFLGLCLAVFVSLRTILLVDLLGLEMLTKSFGLLILFQGVAAFIGPPIAGQLLDKTKSIDNCFYFAGALNIISGLLMLPILFLKTYKDRGATPPLPTRHQEALQLESAI